MADTLPKPDELVSISRCAELLTEAGDAIERSALSRYCKQHGLKGPKRGRTVYVNYEAVRRHRAENYTREVMSGQAIAGSVAPAPATAAPAAPTLTVIDGRGAEDDPAGGQAVASLDPARRLKEAQARKAERELEELEGKLVRIDEVDAGLADAISVFRSTSSANLKNAVDKIIADLELDSSLKRPLRVHVRRYVRDSEAAFAGAMAKITAEAREQESAARRRLTILAAHAARLRGGVLRSRRTGPA